MTLQNICGLIAGMDVGIGLSKNKDPILAAKEAVRLAQINIRSSAKINLAIVFGSIELSSANLLQTISNSLDNIPIIGCSGGVIISNQGITKHGVAIMLLSLPEEVYFNTAYVSQIKSKTSLSAGKELGDKLLYAFQGVRRDLSVILLDGLMGDSSSLISGLQEGLGRSFPFVGGLASDNLRFLKTHLYFNQEVLTDAACGILWGGKLTFGLGIKHGWKPLGKPRYVTKSSGNIIYEIDNAPAANVYAEYLACDWNKLKKELKYISVLYPVGIYLPGEEEYLLRNISSIEEGGALVFRGNVPEASQIRLMIGTKESCLAATQEAADEAKKDLATQALGLKKGPRNKFVLVFDSISRYILLRRDAHKELDIIKEKLGRQTPILGLYTYGEQAPLRAVNYRGQTYFHNQTISILIIEG